MICAWNVRAPRVSGILFGFAFSAAAHAAPVFIGGSWQMTHDAGFGGVVHQDAGNLVPWEQAVATSNTTTVGGNTSTATVRVGHVTTPTLAGFKVSGTAIQQFAPDGNGSHQAAELNLTFTGLWQMDSGGFGPPVTDFLDIPIPVEVSEIGSAGASISARFNNQNHLVDGFTTMTPGAYSRRLQGSQGAAALVADEILRIEITLIITSKNDDGEVIVTVDPDGLGTIGAAMPATGLEGERRLDVQLIGDGFRFHLEGASGNGLWVLQHSTDGRGWRDLAFLEDGEGASDPPFVEVPRGILDRPEAPAGLFRALQLPEDNPLLRRLLAERAKWRLSRIDSYGYELRQNFGQVSWHGTIAVVDGVVDSFAVIEEIPLGFGVGVPTIEGLFARIADAIAQNAEVINVEWDPVFGFPRVCFIDISTLIADEESGWTIESFDP